MNARNSSRYPLFGLFVIIVLFLCACQPAAPATSSQPTQPPAQATLPPTQSTQPPAQPTAQPTVQPTQPSSGGSGDITLDYSAVAQSVTLETVAAVSASAGGPYWETGPQYRRLTLENYTVANNLLKPQIFIYPVADLATANEGMGKIAANLQALLKTQQAGTNLPFLPLFNASQVMHAQVQYLDFKSGKGVRFLTQFDQAPLPINNYELIYTYQGLTSDGKYYIAAVLPITHPDLPASSNMSNEQIKTLSDFPAYLSTTVTMLNQQAADSFTPDLAKLDAMIRSIEIK
jgi:hypothetical protein